MRPIFFLKRYGRADTPSYRGARTHQKSVLSEPLAPLNHVASTRQTPLKHRRKRTFFGIFLTFYGGKDRSCPTSGCFHDRVFEVGVGGRQVKFARVRVVATIWGGGRVGRGTGEGLLDPTTHLSRKTCRTVRLEPNFNGEKLVTCLVVVSESVTYTLVLTEVIL